MRLYEIIGLNDWVLWTTWWIKEFVFLLPAIIICFAILFKVYKFDDTIYIIVSLLYLVGSIVHI